MFFFSAPVKHSSGLGLVVDASLPLLGATKQSPSERGKETSKGDQSVPENMSFQIERV